MRLSTQHRGRLMRPVGIGRPQRQPVPPNTPRRTDREQRSLKLNSAIPAMDVRIVRPIIRINTERVQLDRPGSYSQDVAASANKAAAEFLVRRERAPWKITG